MAYEVLSQGRVEQEIMRISDAMEKAVEELARCSREAAEAEVDHKVAYARTILEAGNLPGSGRGGKMTEGDKEAMAVRDTEHLLRARLVSESRHEVAIEKLRTMRSQLDSLRTISANLRAAT